MGPYEKTKSISENRAITEMDLLRNLAQYYRENNGNLCYDKSTGCWIDAKCQIATPLSDIEVVYTILNTIDAFRNMLIKEQNQPALVIDKLLKHIFRIQNIDVIPRFLAIYLAKEDDR